MLTASAVLIAAALACVWARRDLLPVAGEK
jgi:hypothetical protein